MKIVIIEDVLMKLFSFIPSRQYVQAGKPHVTPKPTYHFGDVKELNKLIVGLNHKMYPVIYQTSSQWQGDSKDSKSTTEITLVIATQTSAQEYNDQRWATTYQNVLIPTLNYIFQVFTKSRVISWDGTYTIDNAPNYSETDPKDKNAFADIVDAIVLTTTIKVDGGVCVDKNIIFKEI